MRTEHQTKVLRLKVVARVTLLAFEIRSDLTGAALDKDMAIVYTKAALVELGYGESADTELAMRLLVEAARVHVPKRAFAPFGFVIPVGNTEQEFYFKTGIKNETPSKTFVKPGAPGE